MFDKVIKDPDWRAALHGQPVMKVTYDGEAFTVCTAKAINAVWGQFAGRGDNPFNLALMIKHHVSWEAWKELPWFAVCDAEERELFIDRFQRGLSYDTLAEQQKLSPSAIRKRCSRMHKKLVKYAKLLFFLLIYAR